MKKNKDLTVGVLLVLVPIVVAICFVNTWVLMLLVGAVHSFGFGVPALSFWQSFIAMIALWFVGSFFKSTSK